MRLRNRQVKAEFWTDPDLLQLPRDMRTFYHGLWHCAEDSGCLEDSPFVLKLLLFPSPLDGDITVEVVTEWVEHLIALKKIIRYEAGGKQYLWLKNFFKHQKLRRPGASEVPLPRWLKWIEPHEENGKQVPGRYEVAQDPVECTAPATNPDTNLIPTSYQTDTAVVPGSYEADMAPKVREGKVREGNGEGNRREGGTGETASCDAPLPDATETERLVLAELKQVKGYPLDFVKDLEHIRALETDFPTLDLVAEAKRWRVYKMDKPLKPKSNARLQFRNWCEISAKRRARDAPPNGMHLAENTRRALALVEKYRRMEAGQHDESAG